MKKNQSQFSQRELDEFKAALFDVNTSFRCANPAPISWYKGHLAREEKRIYGEGDI